VYFLKLLPGTEITEFERERYKYLTRFRPFNNRFGEYKLLDDKALRIIEVEEIACESCSFSKNDFLTIRGIGLMIELLVHFGAFKETVLYLYSRNIDVLEVIAAIQGNTEQYPRLYSVLNEYQKFIEEELYETEGALIEDITNDDKKWNDLISLQGKYFKINLGFVGYCLLGNVEILDDIEKIIKDHAWQNLSPEDMENLHEVLQHDKLLRIIQEKCEGEFKELNLKRDISSEEKYDFERWKRNEYKGNLSDKKLSSPIKGVYSIDKYDALIQKVREYSVFSGYCFYERIFTYGPRTSLRRRYRVINN